MQARKFGTSNASRALFSWPWQPSFRQRTCMTISAVGQALSPAPTKTAKELRPQVNHSTGEASLTEPSSALDSWASRSVRLPQRHQWHPRRRPSTDPVLADAATRHSILESMRLQHLPPTMEVYVVKHLLQGVVGYPLELPQEQDYTTRPALWVRPKHHHYELLACHLPKYLDKPTALELERLVEDARPGMHQCEDQRRNGMKAGGLRSPRNPESLPGLYAREQRNPGIAKKIDDVITALTAELEEVCPKQLRSLQRYVKALSHGHVTAPLSSVASTYDYDVDCHRDERTLNPTAIFWFSSIRPSNATFHLPQLNAWWTLRQHSLLVLDSDLLYHGTQSPEKGAGLLGVALYANKDAVEGTGQVYEAAAQRQCTPEQLYYAVATGKIDKSEIVPSYRRELYRRGDA